MSYYDLNTGTLVERSFASMKSSKIGVIVKIDNCIHYTIAFSNGEVFDYHYSDIQDMLDYEQLKILA